MILLVLTSLGCAKDNPGSATLTDFIPESAAMILETEDPDLFFSNLRNNQFLNQNNTHPLWTNLKSELKFLELIPHSRPALLCFSETNENKVAYIFIGKDLPQELQLDSIANRTVETISSEAGKIRKYTLKDQVTYSSIKDSILFVSNSLVLLEESLVPREIISEDLEKVFRAASDGLPSVFINHERFSGIFEDLFPGAGFIPSGNFSNWSVFDTDIGSTSIKLNGITTASEDPGKFIHLLKGVSPARNAISEIAPRNSSGFYSIAFKEFSSLQKNLDSLSPDLENSPENRLLHTASEAGMIWNDAASIFVVNSEEIENAKFQFASEGVISEEYRGNTIYSYEDMGVFKNLLQPLLKPANLKYYLILDRFFLFAEDTQTLKDLISELQNEHTFSNNEAYRAAMESLSSEASILLVSNNRNFKDQLATQVPEEFSKATANLSFKDYPIAALQFISQSDFAHIHGILSKTDEPSSTNEVTEVAQISLDAPLAAPPVLFDNHRTKGKDIAVQDKENTLYLLSPDGMIYWKKSLESRILGEIQQVDILKNGRHQLAFATQNRLHVIDRDGNDVKPFPHNFNDNITQPLALFDYDNKRDYRFVIVQQDRVYMYDNKGRSVKGFSFSKAGSEILQSPKHIRIGNKDYILIPETSGKLNILSRTGKIRVPLKENLSFSQNEWYEYNGDFISVNQAGELVSISQQGKIDRQLLDIPGNTKLTATSKTLVTLGENQLKIKDNSLTLDFGLYSGPQIFYVNNKIYISVTDTEAQRIFLFDSNGKLLPGFPVYGTSTIDLENLNTQNSPGFTVQGGENEVLLYSL